MEKIRIDFLVSFHEWMLISAVAMLALATIYFVVYLVMVSAKSTAHEKYDFIAAHEVSRLKVVFLFIALFTFFVSNLYGKESWEIAGVSWLAFLVRVFIGLAGGATLVYYISSLIFEYYYPHQLHKRLKALRNQPRFNPKNGNQMRLLREDEEDVHLNEGMRAEEDIFSIDYDVWYDQETGDVIIERYEGHKVALKCNTCGFVTMRVFKEEVVERDDNGVPTQIVRHYQCNYCKSFRSTAFNVSHKDVNDLKNSIGQLKNGNE